MLQLCLITGLAFCQPPTPAPPAALAPTIIQVPSADPPVEVTPPPTNAAPVPPDRWFVMRKLEGTRYGAVLDDHRLSVLGWTEMSFTGSSSPRRDQLPMGFNYLANDFLLQQNWLRVERTIDDKATTPTWGFRSDTILPGSDYRFTLPRGLFNSQLTADNGNPNLYGIDPVQLYAEGYFPQVGRGLDVKVGRFFAQFGVESIDTTLTPFVSRAYTFIYDPFTHTGLLTTLKLSDEWSVQNGVVTGSDIFFGPEANPTYIGGVKWALPDGRASAVFEVILGNGRFDQRHNFNNPQIFDLVLTRKLTDRLTWQFEGLYGFTTNVPDIGFANWYGLINYLSFQIDPQLTGNARLEFFDDIQGQRTGFKGLYTVGTVGVTYKPRPWLWVRPEVRYDYNAEARPFGGRHGLFTAALDLVLRW